MQGGKKCRRRKGTVVFMAYPLSHTDPPVKILPPNRGGWHFACLVLRPLYSPPEDASDSTGSARLIAGSVLAGLFPPVGASLAVDDLKGYAMPGRFEGQVAIVTGGALGIGGATARRLAADGAAADRALSTMGGEHG